MKKITFETLAQIQAHNFAGDHAADSAAFGAIEKFVVNDIYPLADRAEAVRIMYDEGMGCGRSNDLDDATIVKQYIDEIYDGENFQ